MSAILKTKVEIEQEHALKVSEIIDLIQQLCPFDRAAIMINVARRMTAAEYLETESAMVGMPPAIVNRFNKVGDFISKINATYFISQIQTSGREAFFTGFAPVEGWSGDPTHRLEFRDIFEAQAAVSQLKHDPELKDTPPVINEQLWNA
jgi:hypothetical protein